MRFEWRRRRMGLSWTGSRTRPDRSALAPRELRMRWRWPMWPRRTWDRLRSSLGRRQRRRARQKRALGAASQRSQAVGLAWAGRLLPGRTGTARPGRLRKSGCPGDFPTACTHYKGAICQAARQEMSENRSRSRSVRARQARRARNLRRDGPFFRPRALFSVSGPLHWGTRLSTLPALFSAPQMRGRPRG